MTHKKIGIALSGGVDSTTAAALLVKQGFAVEGFFMLLLPESHEQIGKVQRVADQLGIPLHLVDLREQFQAQIIAAFTSAYQQGLTPNPCVVCNEQIKCGLLLEAMQKQGMKAMATGHYAQIKHGRLCRATDPGKDQSYFLCRLPPERLARIIFPLGSWRKEDVFVQARALGFTHFDGSESQDVCFLAGQNLASFLSQQGLPSCSGEIVSTAGKILGQQQGYWKYTVGQRRGLGIPDATPWYVVGLNADKNQVIVGKNEELFQHELLLTDVQWHIARPEQWQGQVQLRSRHQAADAQLLSAGNDRWQVYFTEAQRAVTPGQFAVFYENDLVVGSGVISALKQPITHQ